MELRKISPIELRAVGLDEKWLQARIMENPSILGLGELEIAGREHRQPMGGIIDFLMRDAEAETYYEVEVMLGSLDESHIIRTIEYWDIERQRRPQYDHVAVIVAEDITGRFFNVLRLLNRAVPLVAIKLGAFQMDENSVALHAVPVLNVIEEADVDCVDQVEQTDRAFWEKKSTASSLAIADKIVRSFQDKGLTPRLTYNRHHIALATTGYNFCWLHPRKTEGHCHFELRLTNDIRDEEIKKLQAIGIDASPYRNNNISVSITSEDIEKHTPLILAIIHMAEEIRK